MMGDHEHERLSAYLDDELLPGDRARVAAHLGACAECAARLAELAAVDPLTAALPSEAPEGYFESFPARVRARLGPRAARPRLPVWTWAAAAALLLAVVTPLTLLRRPDAGSSHAARELPAAAPPAPAAARPAPATPEPPSEAQATSAAADELKAEAQPRRSVPVPAPPVPEQRGSGFAAAPGEADARATREPAALPAAPIAAAPEASAAHEQEAAALADEAGMPELLATAARRQAKASGDRQAAEGARDAADAAAHAGTMAARARVAEPAVGAVAAPRPAATETAWRRLDDARPQTPAEWRRLREEWRRFVALDPEGPRADEARVRMLEAGREAWRGGSDPADEALFRRDVAAYLERDDAAQKERVRRLLE